MRSGVQIGNSSSTARPTGGLVCLGFPMSLLLALLLPAHAAGVTLAGDPVVLGKIDNALVDAVVRDNLAAVDACYATARAAAPHLGGRVGVRFVVDAKGAVSSATVKSSTVGDPAFEGCVAAAFSAWTFPAPRAGTVVATYTLTFTP